MKKLIYLSLALAAFWFVFIKTDYISLDPGIFAPDTPIQEKITSHESFSFKDYMITRLADFQIKAKVLSKKNYQFGREAELSPVDLALGWGRMSDESVLDSINISQSGRWYRWRTKNFPIPRREIETHSANMHIIPENSLVESTLDQTRIGDIVEFSGSLVRIDAQDGWHWVRSLTRNDTGNHACEVIFVEDFKIHKF